MVQFLKCAGCDEPLERTARICPACGERVTTLKSTPYWPYVSAGLVVLLAIGYRVHDRHQEIIGLAVSIVLTSIVLSPKSESRRQNEMASKLRAAADFNCTKQFLGCDGKSGIALERSQTRICLLSNDGRRVSRRFLSHRDLLSAELIENGRVVVTSARGKLPEPPASDAEGHTRSGVLAALTGAKPANTVIWQIDLRIRVRSSPNVPHEVAFLSDEVIKGGVVYGNKVHQARGWYRIMDGLIRRTELEDLRAQQRKVRFASL